MVRVVHNIGTRSGTRDVTLKDWYTLNKPIADALGFNSPVRGKQGEKLMESTLYKWMVDGNVVYGKRLAVDGGKLVIKRTDTGALDIMNVSDVVEVLPYTVAIKYNQIGKTYHFHAVEGELAVGDLVLVEDAFTIVIVTAVNTNSRIATKALTGYVLTGAKPLTAPVQG